MLEKNIHVYVDKPISESLEETQELLQLANDKNLTLMTGFNRRFAPLTQRIKKLENKNMIVIRKNRPQAVQNTKFALYDMMIHVVDTALYLLDEPVNSTHMNLREKGGMMDRATLQVETENTTLFAYMNMNSGARPETFEVMTPQGHYIVDDLNTLTIKTENEDTVITFPDWTPVLERRGFKAIIEHFITIIQSQEIYDTENDMRSHAMVESILKTSSQ